MKRQIEKMYQTVADPQRASRSHGTDFPWMSPSFAIAFAIGKLSRVVRFDHQGIQITQTMNASLMAEELRESASYLLRAASLLDPEDDGREVRHDG